MQETKVFSQNCEQDFILSVLKDQPTGKFIDIGAYHVERFSNTRALYLNNWKGVFVEPQPSNYKAIADHYAHDKDITVLNVSIGPETAEIDFYESNGDAVGTTSQEHRDKWGAAGVQYTKIKVPQLSMEDFLNEHGKDCDMLSLDVEAMNYELFQLIPDWFFERLKLIVIEYDESKDVIEAKLSQFGFTTLYTNAENIVAAKI